MKKVAISSAIFTAMHGPVNAALSPDAKLSIEAGSTSGVEVQPGFWMDVSINGFNGIHPGTD